MKFWLIISNNKILFQIFLKKKLQKNNTFKNYNNNRLYNYDNYKFFIKKKSNNKFVKLNILTLIL